MTYASLMADADLYFSLNNTMDHVAPQATVAGTIGSIAPVFLQDAPANTGTTHSLRMSGYGSGVGNMLHNTFTGLRNSGDGKTVTFWYKNTKLDGSTPVLGESTGTLQNIFRNTVSNNTNVESLNINHSTLSISRTSSDNKPALTLAAFNTSTLATATLSNSSTATYMRNHPGKWNHIAVVAKNSRTSSGTLSSTVNFAIYINGICAFFTESVTAQRNLSKDGYGIDSDIFEAFISSANNDVGLKRIAHFGVWNRALTRDEIRQQAAYGNRTEVSYETLALSKNPIYFNTLNNATKNVEPQIFGSSSNWGNITDEIVNLTTDVSTLPSGKGWRLATTSTTSNNFSITNTPAFLNGFSALQKTGEYSFEMWIKINPYYTAISPVIATFGSSASLQDGWLNIMHDGFGRIGGSVPQKATASSYSQRTFGRSFNLFNGGDAIQIGPTKYVWSGTPTNQIGGNVADGEWHHVVLRQTNTLTGANTYTIQLIIDGYIANTVTATSTNGWIDGVGSIPQITFGFNGFATGSPTIEIDSIAFYNRYLLDSDIEELVENHLYYQPPAQGYDVKYYDGDSWEQSVAQKYYDGNAWVDWNTVSEPKRWNGTAWVNI